MAEGSGAAKVADSAAFNTPTGAGRLRRHPQPAGHAASCRPVHDQDARYNGSAVPELPCGGSDPARVGTVGCLGTGWGPPAALALPRCYLAEAPSRPPLGRHWAAIIKRLLCAHHPGQRHAGLPPPARARHAAPLRRRVEGAAHTPPSATKCPRPSLELGPPEGLWRPAQDVLSALRMYSTVAVQLTPPWRLYVLKAQHTVRGA